MTDELNPLARAFLDSVQDADDPTRADFDRVRGKVKTRLAAGIAAGIAALTTSRAAAATATAKVATATAAATSVAAPAATTIATAGAGASIAGKIVAMVAVVAAVGGGTTAVVHYAHRAATTEPAATVATSTAPLAARPAPALRPQLAPAVATTAPETTAAPVVTAAARDELPRAPAVAPAVVPSAPPAAATSVATVPSLDAEIALVRDARAALRGGDPGRSLAILDEHDRRFPGGALSEDCAAERIYALCALGSVDAARATAARFLADHPYSPHAASVRTSCGGAGGMN